jgi:hypothetical protein
MDPSFQADSNPVGHFWWQAQSSTEGRNKVVAPEDNSNSAEHSATTLKERLQEGLQKDGQKGGVDVISKNKPWVAQKFCL